MNKTLAEFIAHLVVTPGLREKSKRSRGDALEVMKSFGLHDEKKQEALLSGDNEAIRAIIEAEIDETVCAPGEELLDIH